MFLYDEVILYLPFRSNLVVYFDSIILFLVIYSKDTIKGLYKTLKVIFMTLFFRVDLGSQQN